MLRSLGTDTVYLVRGVIDSDAVFALQAECDRCMEVYKLSEEDLHIRACAVDLFENCSLEDHSVVRTDREAYLRERRRDLDLAGEVADAVDEIIFSKLPGILMSLFPIPQLLLFNEHYVVKPGSSSLEFSWHIDEEKQLGVLSPEEFYLTIWCPLDITSDSNGTLIFPHGTNLIEVGTKSAGVGGKRERVISGSEEERHRHNSASDQISSDGLPVEVMPGTCVVFHSKMPHRSGINTTEKVRRVFYAQYSPTPIGGASAPLNFAIPTTPLLFEPLIL